MPTITLEEMKEVQLMNRIDQKYMLNREQLHHLLEHIVGEYYVQRIEGVALSPYKTLYFDTSDLAMYTMHHNKKGNRQKLRVRCYRGSLTTFFEIKNKNNKGRTAKIRGPIAPDEFYTSLSNEQVDTFLSEHCMFPLASIQPQLENTFRRITLVDNGKTERVTIDSEIHFHNLPTQTDHDLSPLVVLEVKHGVGAPLSTIQKALLEMRISPNRMSKYCIGTALTNQHAKTNRFKPKIRYINELITN